MMQRTISRSARMLLRTIVFTACIATACLSALHAQTGTITAGPKAVALRQVWATYGNPASGEHVGISVGGIPDVNGDRIDEFAVCFYGLNQWRIYYGRDETIVPFSQTPDTILKGYGWSSRLLPVGDFWGTGHSALVLPVDHVVDGTVVTRRFEILRTDAGRIDSVPSLVLNPLTMKPQIGWKPTEVVGFDLDGDRADELIIYAPGVVRDSTYSRYPEIWIFRGGSDFRVDTPTVILRDTEMASDLAVVSLHIGRVDNDRFVDIVTGCEYADGSYKLKFWFGTSGSPWNGGVLPREVLLDTVPDGSVISLNCDGDSLLDLIVPSSQRHPDQMRLYRSNNEKNARTRTFAPEDADKIFHMSRYMYPVRLGALNDKDRHFDMLGLSGLTTQLSEPTLLGFSGGPNGPDSGYDAFYAGENVGYPVCPLGDVTGDGWPDVLVGSFAYGIWYDGAAWLLAGGPYIPHDSTSGVDAVAGEGHERAVSVWPNPATDELHIAWRGDLKHMPARFTVHNLLGDEVARGDVEPWRGAAMWHCADLPAGVYLLSISDASGTLIATTHVIKEGRL